MLYSLSSVAQIRQEYLLENNWKFTKGAIKHDGGVRVNDKGWETVSVPHDWAIKGPFNGNNDVQNVQIVQNGETGRSLKAGTIVLTSK